MNKTDFELFKMFVDNLLNERSYFKMYSGLVIYGKYFGKLKTPECKSKYINFKNYMTSMFLEINEPVFNICRLLLKNHSKIHVNFDVNHPFSELFTVFIDNKIVRSEFFNDKERILISFFVKLYIIDQKEKEALLEAQRKILEEQQKVKEKEDLIALCKELVNEKICNKAF